MDENVFYFGQNCSIDIKINYPEKEQISGKLILKPGKFPVVEIEDYNKSCDFLTKKKKIECLKCYSSKTHFLIYDCDISFIGGKIGDYCIDRYRIYFQFIIDQFDDQKIQFDSIQFDSIKINIGNLNSWFHFCEHNEQEIKSKKNPEFHFKISLSNKEINISNNFTYNKSFSCEKININKRAYLILKSSSKLSITDVKTYSIELKALITFLSGFSSSIKYLYGINDGKTHQIYFADSFGRFSDMENSFHGLIRYKNININTLNKIFETYFKNDEIRETICNLSALIGYNDIIEYEFFMFFSLFEKLITKNITNRKREISETKFENLKKELKETVRYFLYFNKSFSTNIFSSFKKQIKSLKNTDLPHLNDKFNFYFDNLNQNVIKILAFKKSDFNYLKDTLRNPIAHGSSIKEKNYSKLNQLTTKLILLTYYQLLADLGMKDNEILDQLFKSHHRYIYQADINKINRDRILGLGTFIHLPDDTFKLIKKQEKKIFSIILEKKENNYFFNEKISSIYKERYCSEEIIKYKSLNKYVESLYSGNGNVKAEWQKNPYIVNQNTKEEKSIIELFIVHVS